MKEDSGPKQQWETTIMRIDEIIINDRFRKDIGDLTDLEASIRKLGLLQPLVVTPDKKLICGYRRICVCKSLGWTEIPVRIVDIKNALAAEHDENVVRLDFSPSEKVAITEALREQVKAEAKNRQLERLKNVGQPVDRAICPNEKTEPTGRTEDILARAVGTSRKTLEKAREVVKAAEENSDYRDLVEEMDTTGKVDAAYREMKSRKELTELQACNVSDGSAHIEVIAYHSRDWLPNHAREMDCLITQVPYCYDGPRIFKSRTKEWLSAAAGCLKYQGVGFLICKPSRVFEIVSVLSEIGCKVKSMAVWRNGTCGEAFDKGAWDKKEPFSVGYDLILQFDRGRVPVVNGLGGVFEIDLPDNCWKGSHNARTEVPVEVIERLLLAATKPGDKVLDPFACTGYTGLACKKHGRDCFMLEEDRKALKVMLGLGIASSATLVRPSFKKEVTDEQGAKKVVRLSGQVDLGSQKLWLEKHYREIDFDFDSVETTEDIANMLESIDNALNDPTVDVIESVSKDAVNFRLTKEEIDRRRAEEEEMRRDQATGD